MKAECFCKFLMDIGVLTKASYRKYIQNVNQFELAPAEEQDFLISPDDDETRLIFCLTDILKSADTEAHYDMAERLYKNWEAKIKRDHETKLTKLFGLLYRRFLFNVPIVLNILKMQSKSNPRESSFDLFQSYESFERKDRNSIRVSPERNQPNHLLFIEEKIHNSLPSNDILEVLNSKDRNQQSKPRDIFSKLHSGSKIKQTTQILNENIRLQREVQHCTFTPVLQQKFKENRNSFSPSREASSVHSRLHREYAIRMIERSQKQKARENRDLVGCTFAPKIGKMRRYNSMQDNVEMELHERLYRDYEKKNKAKVENELALENGMQKECTFSPKIQKVNFNRDDHIPVHDRLLQKHKEKQMLMEEKRRELLEEEHRMHNIVNQRKAEAQTDFYQIPGKVEEPIWERLYNEHRNETYKKSALKKKVEREEGTTFSPKINNRSMPPSENLTIAERGAVYQLQKQKKGYVQTTQLMSHHPQILSPKAQPASKVNVSNKRDVVERLSSYLDYYDKIK